MLGVLSLVCFFILTAIPAVICGHLALSRIKRSGGMLAGNGLAIGGLVAGYVGIAFSIAIATVAVISIPNFVKVRPTAQQNACISNLRYIDIVKQQWAAENKKSETDTPSKEDVIQFMKNQQFPVCPAGGTYTINAVDQDPKCSIPTHRISLP